jgi:hypothetical protein
MSNKILNTVLIISFSFLAISFNSCKKAADTKAIITVIDINGVVVTDAKVRLHQDGIVSQAGQYSEVINEQWTDDNGQTEHVFENEAILKSDVSKWVGTNELTGSNVVRLLKNKTVNKTIQID